jgi:hypothetical protein
MIDGLDNSVCEVDVVPSDAPTGSQEVRLTHGLLMAVTGLSHLNTELRWQRFRNAKDHLQNYDRGRERRCPIAEQNMGDRQ